MNEDDLYTHPGWKWYTFEGARREVLLRGRTTTFREKLEWLEEAETLSLRFQQARAARRSGPSRDT